MTVDLSTSSRDSSRPSELRKERTNAANPTSDKLNFCLGLHKMVKEDQRVADGVRARVARVKRWNPQWDVLA
jgi:hypothetical protein